jgi:hypothetical protein
MNLGSISLVKGMISLSMCYGQHIVIFLAIGLTFTFKNLFFSMKVSWSTNKIS